MILKLAQDKNWILIVLFFLIVLYQIQSVAQTPVSINLAHNPNSIAGTMKLASLVQRIVSCGCNDTLTKRSLIDSYRNAAHESGSEEDLLNSHLLLGDFLLDCKGDSRGALVQYTGSAAIAKAHGYKKLAVKIYIGIAQVYQRNSENIKALENYLAALEQSPDVTYTESICGNIGNIYNILGDYTQALANYERAYTIHDHLLLRAASRDQSDTLVLMLLLINIANVNVSLRQHQNAIDNFMHVRKLNVSVKNELFEIYSLEGMGNCLQLMNNFADAISYYNAALEKSKAAYAYGEECNILNNLGNIYLARNDLKVANQYARRALAIAQSPKGLANGLSLTSLPTTYSLLSRLYSKQMRSRLAVIYLRKAIVLYRRANRMDDESEAWRELSFICELTNKPAAALQAHKRYISLRDSVFSQEKAKEITRIELGADFRRHHLSDSLLQARKELIAASELQRQKRDKRFFIAGSILLFTIAAGALYFLIYARRARKRIELLMREMHHRVKNNLQIIGTLLSLQLANVFDSSARKSIEESITRISSIALIHHHLYRVDDLSSIELSGFINELFVQISGVYSTEEQQVTSDFHLPEMQLDIDTALPLGLIINELMTNSFKYAYPAIGNSKMGISLSQIRGNYTLRYYDYGVGLPDSFVVEQAESLGMKLIYSLSNQIGGNFHYDKAENCFVVTFKDTLTRRDTA